MPTFIAYFYRALTDDSIFYGVHFFLASPQCSVVKRSRGERKWLLGTVRLRRCIVWIFLSPSAPATSSGISGPAGRFIELSGKPPDLPEWGQLLGSSFVELPPPRRRLVGHVTPGLRQLDLVPRRSSTTA